MLNKKLVSILLGSSNANYEKGIKLVRALNLNKFEYGWNLSFKNKKEEDSLIVDYLLHANETLYDFDEIDKLLKKSNLYGYSIFGITTGTQGLLFDSRHNSKKGLNIPQTNIRKFFSSSYTTAFYKTLTLKDKCRIIDLLSFQCSFIFSFIVNAIVFNGLTFRSFEHRQRMSRLK